MICPTCKGSKSVYTSVYNTPDYGRGEYKCNTCTGTGVSGNYRCSTCDGRGIIGKGGSKVYGGSQSQMARCGHCNGTGQVAY